MAEEQLNPLLQSSGQDRRPRPWNLSSTIATVFPDDNGETTNHLLEHGNHPFAQLGNIAGSPIPQTQIDAIRRQYRIPDNALTLPALGLIQGQLQRRGPRPTSSPAPQNELVGYAD